MSTFHKICNKIKEDIKSQKFPFISTTILTLASSSHILNKIYPFTTQKPLMHNIKSFITNILHDPSQKIPTIPEQNTIKPTFIFDIDNFIIRRSYPIPFFNYSKITKRAYTGTFLFHMAHIYDLILLTNMNSNEGRSIIEKIDPYGCINYRMFVKDKKKFTVEKCNRDIKSTIFLQTENDKLGVSDDFKNNVIRIDEWDGKEDDRLLRLLDFCVNLHFMGVKDFRNTIMSYQGKNFFDAFESIRKKIFSDRNIFCFNVNNAFKKHVTKINNERLVAYENAKVELDQHLMRDKVYNSGENIYNSVYNAIISRLF